MSEHWRTVLCNGGSPPDFHHSTTPALQYSTPSTFGLRPGRVKVGGKVQREADFSAVFGADTDVPHGLGGLTDQVMVDQLVPLSQPRIEASPGALAIKLNGQTLIHRTLTAFCPAFDAPPPPR